MKFSIGDKILLKRTGEEGVVIAMLSQLMMEVAVNGVHFPVYSDEVDHPYLKWFTEQKKPRPRVVQEVPMERIKERPPRLVRGIYLSFMPVYIQESMEDIVSDIRIYLLNETAAPLYFLYSVKGANGERIFSHQGSLHAFGNVYLHSLSLEEMNEQPRFNWTLNDDGAIIHSSDNKGTLRIKPQKLFEQITTIQSSGAPAFTYLLADDCMEKVKAPMYFPPIAATMHAPTTNIPTSWQPKEILDLHIENLREHYHLLTSAEILQIQVDTLHYNLDMAIAHEQQNMVIIHGLGIGVLRDIVHDVLSEKRGIDYYKNEWNGRYGYGATVVTFKH